GEVTARLPLKAPRLARSALQFNRDGSRLALGTPDTRELRVLDTATGATAWAVKLGKETPGGTAFAADGGTVAVATDAGLVRLFGRAGEPAGVLAAPGTVLGNVALSPNGQMAVAHDRTSRELIAWDRGTRGIGWKKRYWGDHSLTFSPDGRTLLQAAEGF